MLRVGLTGGIACGKSHVLRRLAARGLAVLDLDAVAHAVTAPGGAAYDDVVAAFGESVVAADGTIDRRALGALVFRDPVARARLDALVHPRVRAEERRLAGALEREGHELVVSDGALLVEAGAHLRFERLVVVHCPPEEQLRRLMHRDGLAEAAARERVAAQMPVAEKRRYAHALVDTSGSMAQTEAQADRLAEELQALAARPAVRVGVGPESALGVLACGGMGGPRGLTAAGLLAEAVDAGGIELPRLARRLAPPAAGPWYRAARAGEAAPWPEALSPALALWAAARGLDADWLAAAAASLARLTHPDDEAVAGAVLAALLSLRVACGEAPAELPGRLAGLAPAATRWGGVVPPARVSGAVEAAVCAPADPARAARLAARAGAEPEFAAALVGLARGLPPAGADAGTLALARRLVG